LQSGQGFPSAARALAEAWGRPVLLQDPSLDIRAVGLPSTGSRGEPQCDALLKDRLSGRMIGQLHQHLINAVAGKNSEAPDVFRMVPVAWERPARNARGCEDGSGDDEARRVVEYFFPLTNDDQDVGYLSVLHAGDTVQQEALPGYVCGTVIVSLAFQRLLGVDERHL